MVPIKLFYSLAYSQAIADDDITSIQINTDTWSRLNMQKQSPSDSFDDVVNRLLDHVEACDEEPADAVSERTHSAQTIDHARKRTASHSERSEDSENIDVPGKGETADARRAAICDMRDELRDRGTAEKTDLLKVVDAGKVSYASVESFWSNAVKGRDSLKSLDGVEPPAEGGRKWRWIGD